MKISFFSKHSWWENGLQSWRSARTWPKSQSRWQTQKEETNFLWIIDKPDCRRTVRASQLVGRMDECFVIWLFSRKFVESCLRIGKHIEGRNALKNNICRTSPDWSASPEQEGCVNTCFGSCLYFLLLLASSYSAKLPQCNINPFLVLVRDRSCREQQVCFDQGERMVPAQPFSVLPPGNSTQNDGFTSSVWLLHWIWPRNIVVLRR